MSVGFCRWRMAEDISHPPSGMCNKLFFQAAIQKRDDLPPSTILFRAEGRGSHTVGDAVYQGPGYCTAVVGIGSDIRKRSGGK